jgi:hypothetical protein
MEKIIGEIIKTGSVKTMVRITEFKGRTFLDVRDFFKGKNTVDFGPTKKGIAIDIAKVSELVNLLEKAESEIAAQK